MMLDTEVLQFDDDITGISCYGRFTLGTRLSETEGLINSLIEKGTRKLVLDEDGGPWLFFDLARDPAETRNLTQDPARATEMAALRRWL